MDNIRALRLYGIPDDNRVSLGHTPGRGPRLSAPGNTPFPARFADPRLVMRTLYLGGFRGSDPPRLDGSPDLVVNGICNADIAWGALRQADELCAEARRRSTPVVNPPERVAHTSREALPGLLGGTPGLQVPAVVRIKAPTSEALRNLIAGGEIPFPFTVGPAGQTNGVRLVRIQDGDALWKLDMLPFDGRDFLLSPLPDYWSEDGLYRRFRMVRIGNRLLPGQLLIGERWDLHRWPRRFMLDRPRLQAEEQAFLGDPFGFLGRDRIATVREVFARVGLDFAAIDFAPVADGLLLLKCNPCFDAYAQRPRFPYLAPHTRALGEAVEEMLLARAEAA